MFFENFARTEIKTSGARIVTVYGGNGPPLLLTHGNPFSFPERLMSHYLSEEAPEETCPRTPRFFC